MAGSNKPLRSPEEIEAWRQELRKPGRTLQMIADREGISRQRVAQLVGKLHRRYPVGQTADERAEIVVELAVAARSDDEIAEETGVSVSTVRQYRRRAGIHRPDPGKKWTPELIIEFAQKWYERFGSLSSTDWSVSYLRIWGHEARLKRFYELGAPHSGTVLQYFPNWNTMLKKAGLPVSQHGGAKTPQ